MLYFHCVVLASCRSLFDWGGERGGFCLGMVYLDYCSNTTEAAGTGATPVAGPGHAGGTLESRISQAAGLILGTHVFKET